MATRLLEKYKWTKDGRKWVFYTWTISLDGKRKKYTSKAYHTKKEALDNIDIKYIRVLGFNKLGQKYLNLVKSFNLISWYKLLIPPIINPINSSIVGK